MFKQLYDALVLAGTPGTIQLKDKDYLQIIQYRNFGENKSVLFEVVYSIVPWPASPDTPVLYFTVSKIPIGQNSFSEQDEDPVNTTTFSHNDDEYSSPTSVQHIEQITDISQILPLLVPDPFIDQFTNTTTNSNKNDLSSLFDTTNNAPLLSIPPLSQAEHPATGLPAFYLHPCNTHAFINNELALLGNKHKADDTFKLYLWLQTFGRTVGLEIPPPHLD